MKKVFLVCILMFPFITHAGDSFLKFISQGGPSDNLSMIRFSSNNFIVSSNDTSSDFTGWNGYLTSWDSAGNVQWNFIKPYRSYVRIAKLGNNNFVSSSMDSAGVVYLDIHDFFGNLIQTKSLDNVISIVAMKSTLDKGVIINGATGGGNHSIFKLDSALNYQWGHRVFGTYNPQFDLCQFDDSSYAFTGVCTNTLTNLDNGSIVYIDKNGVVENVRSYEGQSGSLVFSVVSPLPDRGVLLTADFTKTQCFNAYTGSDILKIDSAGQIVFDFHPPCNLNTTDIIYASELLGNLIIMLVRLPDSMGGMIGIIKADTSGNIISINNLNLPVTSSTKASMIAENNHVYLSVITDNIIVFGKINPDDLLDCTTPESLYTYEDWISQSGAASFIQTAPSSTTVTPITNSTEMPGFALESIYCLALGLEEDLSKSHSSIYPVPASENITFNTEGASEILIYDIAGRVVKEIHNSSAISQMIIYVGDLKPGQYTIHSADKISTSSRFVKITDR